MLATRRSASVDFCLALSTAVYRTSPSSAKQQGTKWGASLRRTVASTATRAAVNRLLMTASSMAGHHAGDGATGAWVDRRRDPRAATRLPLRRRPVGGRPDVRPRV